MKNLLRKAKAAATAAVTARPHVEVSDGQLDGKVVQRPKVRHGPRVVDGYPSEAITSNAPCYERRLKGREIRLLRLCPEEPSDQFNVRFWKLRDGSTFRGDVLRFELKVVSLDDDPQYHALSYIWGTPPGREDIICNGSQLSVSWNLYRFLTFFRKQSLRNKLCTGNGVTANEPDEDELHPVWRQEFWWVDAVCINQGDVLERNSQVRMMGDIFANACRTLVWLGQDSPQMTRSLRSLENFTRSVLAIEQDPASHLQSRDAAEDSAQVLFREPWFSRAWTLQEVLLAQGAFLCYGPVTLSWREFRDAWTGAEVLPSSLGASYHSLDFLQTTFDNGRREPLSNLLLLTRHRQASDIRDKVFSLLALLPDHDAYSLLQPDYRLPIQEVCVRTTRSCLLADGDLSILCFSGLQNQVKNDLPSWVVDWRPAREMVDATGRRAFPTCYPLQEGIRDSIIRFGPRSTGDELQVRGLVIGVFETGSWKHLTAIWRAEYIPRSTFDLSYPTTDQNTSEYSTYRELATIPTVSPTTQTPPEYRATIILDKEGREREPVTFRPQAGDLICLLLGGSGPYVLRRSTVVAPSDFNTINEPVFQLVGQIWNIHRKFYSNIRRVLQSTQTRPDLDYVEFVLV